MSDTVAGGIQGANAGGLVASIRARIDAGALSAGDALPSIRTLATELGLNRNTVAAAYAQLAAAGIVETRRRGGTIVLGVPNLDGEGQASEGGVVNLSSGNPDPAFLPRMAGVLDAGYSPPLYGTAPVSEELQRWAAQHMTPDVAGPHRLVLTHGSVDAVDRLLGAYLTRGDTVAVEDPCFLSSIGALRLGGFQSAPVAVDEEGMTVEGLRAALAAGARALVCTPRAHNPTGASLSPARVAALREVLAGYPGVLVVEDDHFSAVSSRPYLRVTPPDAHRWALVRSVSKFLGPDLRVAFVLADPDTATRLESRLSSATTWVSHILQHLVARLLADPHTHALLDRARASYAGRSGLLVAELTGRGLPMQRHTDGLNVWVPLPGRPRQVVNDLAKRGWAVRPGENFAVGDRPPPAIRVTTATLSPQQATAFAADLAAVLQMA
ncbi:aminotransferase class I/II-fold pyridoxal phosphate-dependent enzyme [Acrocarpospora catenulata]|uniref:aminotransferase class I/II-fold pyridoxal phosphate-dependent enzyme n=1 Tax=Acrocarpospora catenulata TaxID=2836182 RepID=UPI001BDAE634|nr:aminotransferase class I/II-fold pyridoxal phosphate-dependent enzyme [Acrocarpospora catenulata]